jgi:hypothetical protein
MECAQMQRIFESPCRSRHPNTRRLFTKAFRETAGFTYRKLLVSAAMAVFVRLALWWFGGFLGSGFRFDGMP